MKKLLALFFIILLSFENAYGNDISLNAQSAVIIDAATGRILWEKDSQKPMAMASTTKIMTAIIALENSNIKEKTTVSKNAALAPKVKMNLTQGEEITIEELLYALLMQSSNDAAVAIAEHVGGSVENFCKIMTDKAKELGCRDTLFETPNGLDKGNHHSTAYDMALIGAYAIKNDEFLRISNTDRVEFQTNKNHYVITNKNQLLGSYKGAIGIKTGFTGKAGHCFVGAAKRGDITLVTTVLACGWGQSGKAKKWSDTKKLLDYGFDNYSIFSLQGENVYANVTKSKDKSTVLIPDGYKEVLLKKDESDTIKFVNNVESPLTAPINKGDILGTSNIYVNNSYVGQINLIATEDIEENSFYINFKKVIKGWLYLCL